jgi:hypothetical protein
MCVDILSLMIGIAIGQALTMLIFIMFTIYNH